MQWPTPPAWVKGLPTAATPGGAARGAAKGAAKGATDPLPSPGARTDGVRERTSGKVEYFPSKNISVFHAHRQKSRITRR